MKLELVICSASARYVSKLPVQTKLKIYEALERATKIPWAENLDIVPVKDRKLIYRIRVGNYRIGVRVDLGKRELQVVAIAPRGDFYKRLLH